MSQHRAAFATAVGIADAINAYAKQRYGMAIAAEQDFRTITVKRPAKISASRLMAEIGALTIEPDSPARIVIDERTGTIVIGSNVRISKVAVTHGNLTVRVSESPTVSQPAPLSQGQTAVQPATEVAAKQDGGQMAMLEGTSLEVLVDGLNKVGLKPQGIIAILQAIKTAGAVQADLVLQ
jgi:flagellar P-ring protein precursor FlgI